MIKNVLLFEKPIELMGVLLMTIGMLCLAKAAINHILQKLHDKHPKIIVIPLLYIPFLSLLLFCINKLLPIF
jgi:hypothetical protein